MPPHMKRILFVCTGNSCRSVMAHSLLQQRLKEMAHRLREPVEVGSAGVFAMEGLGASKETLRLLQRTGIDASSHMSRPLSDDMIRQADWIFVMEPFHQDEILRRVPRAKDRVHLLKTFGLADPEAAGDSTIADPIGQPPEIYEICFALIREAVDRVAQHLLSAT